MRWFASLSFFWVYNVAWLIAGLSQIAWQSFGLPGSWLLAVVVLFATLILLLRVGLYFGVWDD